MRRARLVNGFGKGVLDPGLGERIDLVHYYQAVRRGEGVEFLPQGGFTRAGGTRLATTHRLRHKLEPIRLTSTMITAHNGGTVASLLDQDDTTSFTTSPIGGTEFAVLEVDLGAPMTVAAFDLVGYSCASSRLDAAVACEYYDGTSWVAVTGPESTLLSPRANIRTDARTRRYSEPPGESPTARSWRIVIYGGVGLGAISVKGIRMWTERADVSPKRRAIPFAKSSSEVYQLTATDWNIDVFDDGVYLASIPLAVPHHLVKELTLEQSQDTLFLFHEDVATQQITRQGAPDEWDVKAVAFTNVPNITASTAFTGAQDEVQRIAIDSFAASLSLTVSLGDLFAAPFTSSTTGALAGQVQTALGGLPGVTLADVDVQLVSVSPPTLEVTFKGANGSRFWPRIGIRGGAVDAFSTVKQRGVPSSGGVLGTTTGWPRCGAVHQARMLLGGFRASPQTILASQVGDLFNLKTDDSPVLATTAIMHTLDTDQVEVIQAIFIGRHLQIFTESGEWWSDNRTLDATQPVNFILATRYGLSRAVPLQFAESATLFLEKGGRTVRDFLYNDATLSYEADALSLLAPHLVTGAVSLAWRRAEATDQANQLYVVNDDGTLAVLSLLRKQEVVAWSTIPTDGQWRDVMTDALDRVWLISERGGELWLEKRDEDALMHATVEVDGSGLGQVTGLPAYMEGRTVYALADGDIQGPFTVSAGAILLGAPADTTEVGLPFTVDVESLDTRARLNEEMPFRPPARIYEAELALTDTGHLQFGANGAEPEEVALRHVDGEVSAMDETGDEPANDRLDVPMMDRLFSGRVRVENLAGFTKTARWRIRQTVPAPLTVKSLRLEIAMRG